MPLGGVEILSRDHFEAVFRDERTMDAMKGAAAALGERCGCGVMFVGMDAIYVRFTRKQSAMEVRRSS